MELTFCWKLIGVSNERWSRGARTRSGARIEVLRFGGFDDLGVLKIDRKSQETNTFVLRKLTTNTRAVLLLGGPRKS